MKFSQIVKKIKQDSWWSEESPGNYEIILTAWRCFVAQNQVYKRKFLSICLALYKNDFCMEKTSEQEKLKQFYWALRTFRQKPDYFKKAFLNYKRAQKELIRYGQWVVDQRKKFSNKDLAKAYLKVYDLGVSHYANSIIPESGDVYTDHYLMKDFARAIKGRFNRNFLVEAASTLSVEPMLSFMEQERADFLNLVFKKKHDYEKFSEKYYWMQNNYLRSKFLTASYFRKEAAKLLKNKLKPEIRGELLGLKNKINKLKKKQKELLRQLTLPNRLKKIFELLRLFSLWIDQRKFGAMHMVYYIDTMFSEIVRRAGVDRELWEYATAEEVADLLLNRKTISKKVLISRRKLSVYVITAERKPFKEYIFIGKKARQIFRLFQTSQAGVIRGFVASAPVEKLKGIAQIIINPHKEKFVKGRILVTTMTRPDFVPFLRQAAAIITDEGGITSHAAIVSRELGIPCIIGTKNGSKILKTGDRIEIDTRSGIIKKI